MKHILALVLMLGFTLASPSSFAADKTSAAQPAKAFFVNLKDGARVKSPVHIKFGLKGMTVAPAGTSEPGTGHFHLLIDTTLTDEQMKSSIPHDSQHIHFGKGQTETDQVLAPGKHTLQLVMGDGRHRLHNPPVMSKVITVVVPAS